MDMAELGIVVATYNEADNLGPLVEALEVLAEDLHLFIVDDNSPDGTQQLAQSLSATYGNITVVGRPAKLGLGSALMEGFKVALATDVLYIMTMDADHSHDVADVNRLLQVIRSGEADMVQGSRYVKGGGVYGWDFRRHMLSRVANLLYHWCAGAPHESTVNFRIFSRRAASVVEERAKKRGYDFVPEATLLVQAAGLSVREVPIMFGGRVVGKSKFGPKQALIAIISFFIVSVQYRLRLGRFGRRSEKNT
jgi:dolichol-phosphate mannosyltransferase